MRPKKLSDGARQVRGRLPRWRPERDLGVLAASYRLLDLLQRCQRLSKPIT